MGSRAGSLAEIATTVINDSAKRDAEKRDHRLALARPDSQTEIISTAVGDRGIVRVQLPLRLGEASEPQPDITVVVARADYYEHCHPVAADTLLAIELSDTTLHFDRDVKAPLYVHQGVSETWIVDLRANRLLRFRRSATRQEIVAEESDLGAISLDALPGVTVDLAPLVTRATER